MKAIRRYVADASARVGRLVSAQTRPQRNVNIALAALVQNDLSDVFDATAYIQLLRECIEPMSCRVVTLRADSHVSDPVGLRFQTLLDCIRGNLPPIPTAQALEIAHAADALRSVTTLVDFERWSGDVGLHFAISSSRGRDGRLLSSIVRFCRPKVCLELGTAYGLSVRFILGTQTQVGTPNLTTIEGHQPTYALVSRQLSER